MNSVLNSRPVGKTLVRAKFNGWPSGRAWRGRTVSFFLLLSSPGGWEKKKLLALSDFEALHRHDRSCCAVPFDAGRYVGANVEHAL